MQGCGLELHFDPHTQAWSDHDQSLPPAGGDSTLLRKLSRFVPRRRSTRTSLLALAQNVDALCILLPDGKGPAENMGALIKLQVYGIIATPDTIATTAASGVVQCESGHGISNPQTTAAAAGVQACIDFSIEAVMRGEQIPVSLASSLASKQPAVPMLCLSLPSPPSKASTNGGGSMASSQSKALGSPLVLSVDLQGCRGPGQICINVWSGGSLLISNRGLVLPAASEAVAGEITRHSRSWSETMLGNLAAMIECTEVVRSGGTSVCDQRRPQPRNGMHRRGARGPALVPIEREYVGKLVWVGQNLLCKAEEGGWRATAQLLDEMIKASCIRLPPLHPTGMSCSCMMHNPDDASEYDNCIEWVF